MKAKVNIPTRGKSNPPLKNLPPSSLLEEQTKKMEQRLKELKEVMAEQAAKRETFAADRPSGWVSANQNMPIKNYAEVVLKSKSKDPLNKSGKDNSKINLQQKQSRERTPREKMPPLLAPMVTTPGGTGSLSQTNKENESQKDFFKVGPGAAPTNTSMTSSATKVVKPQRSTKIQEDEKVAENNINKVLAKPKGISEVDRFLEEVGLPQYIPVFKEHGFDEMEVVMEIQTKHLVEMKIPAGHQIKLSKRIDQLRQSNREAMNASSASNQKGNNVVAQISKNQIKPIIQKGSEYSSAQKTTKEQGIGEENVGGAFQQGAFNEAESHKTFVEALNDWRSGKTAPNENEGEKRTESRAKNSRAKKVRFEEPGKEEEKSNMEKVEAMTKKTAKDSKKDEKKPSLEGKIPAQKETSTNMSPREAQASQKAKVSCWQCYKLISDDLALTVVKKQFCSDDCVKKYRDFNSSQCMKKGCQNKFLKDEGVLREGKWYCSEKCAPTLEEILMEEQRLLRRIEREEGKSSSHDDEEERGNSEQTGPEESGENMEGEEGEESPPTYDLKVGVSNKKEVLTLAELEEKYKNLNEVADKEENEGEVDFEDSLN